MPSIKHIVFPVDFSDRCIGAAPSVAEMARRHDAKITLIAHRCHAAALQERAGGSANDWSTTTPRRFESELDSAFTKYFAGLKVDRMAVLGDPGRVISDYVRAHKVDLVMMPTHGYGPFRQLLLGSVTAKLLHDADDHVWTAAHADWTKVEHLAPHTILCAIDASPASVELMRWAAELCKNLGATLRLVHAVPAIEGWPERPLDRKFEETLADHARRRIQNSEKTADIEVPICLGLGTVPNVIREEVLEHKADLVLSGCAAGDHGTNAHALLRHAPCPALSV